MPRFQSFFIMTVGILVIGLGLHAHQTLPGAERFAILNGCLTLGGGLLIAGLFSLKLPAHGIIGAGVVALLGAARGIANFPSLAAFLVGDRPRAHAPVIEAMATLLSLIVLVHAMRWLLRERIRRMLENS